MARLFLICGLPGSGKTTFAKQFAAKNSFAYLSIDDCYAEINGDETDHSNKFKVWQRFYYLINAYQENKTDLVVEAMSLDHFSRHEFISWFPNFSHHLIIITNDFEECCRNAASRRRKISRSGMLELKKRYTYPDVSEQNEWDSGVHIIAPQYFVAPQYFHEELPGAKDHFDFTLLEGVVKNERRFM